MHIPPSWPQGAVSRRIPRFSAVPCKSLKTRSRLCIEFYALVSSFDVGTHGSLEAQCLLGFRVTFQHRCTADFRCVSWFLPTTHWVALLTRFPQADRINSRERAYVR